MALGGLLTSCGPEHSGGSATSGSGFGSISAIVVWPQGAAPARLAPDGPQPLVAPAGVVSITATVSAPDMADVSTTVTATPGQAGSGTIGNVPAGTNRTLTLQGKNSGGTVIYQGATASITVVAGQTTAPVTVTMQALGSSVALYAQGANWNEYVKNDGASRFTATDTPCDGTETGGYGACIHGGEVRSFDTALSTACASLTATDALGAFDWVCDDSGETTFFRSSGLKTGKYLSDLIDFTALAWRPNQLTVKNGAATVFTSPSETWWGNPIVAANSGLSASAAVAGTIYVVTGTSSTSIGYILGASHVALVIEPGVTLTALGSLTSSGLAVISANSQHFLWLEGVIRPTDSYAIKGVFWQGVTFSVIRGMNAANFLVGVSMSGSSNNLLDGVTASNFSGSGVGISSSSDNLLTSISAGPSTGAATGISLSQSPRNALSGIQVFSNPGNGVALSSSSDNRLDGILAANNSGSGISVASSSNNVISSVAISNGGGGIALTSSQDNTITGVTVAGSNSGLVLSNSADNIVIGTTGTNSAGSSNYQFALVDSSNNVLAAIAAANNVGGLGLSATSTGSNNNLLSGIAAAHNFTGLYVVNTSNNRFTGPLKNGNNTNPCVVNNSILGSNPGLVNTTCANQGASDAVLTLGISLAASFVGKVAADDPANVSDTSGAGAITSNLDWTHFANAFRTWGKDGAAFPSTTHQGRWVSGTGHIWDWSLSASDTILRAVLADPSGMAGITHTWSPTTLGGCNTIAGASWNGVICTSTFLPSAVEILDDAIGNDNGLCEAGEACLYTPNIGSYQGHGALVSKAYAPAASGGVAGVTMFEYATNGR